MREKQSKLVRTNAGITLIALVITVIVMLILAGVAINLTIGDNGIFKKSQEGAQIYKNSANNEATSLNSVDKKMGDLINQYQGGSTTPSEKPGKPNGDGIYTENSTINSGTPDAFNPEIPKGFKPKDEGTADWGDGTTPPTEEAVKAGLIIEDTEGNQFVWIAVDGTEVVLGRYVFTATGEIDTIRLEPTDQLSTGNGDTDYQIEGLKEDTTPNVHAKDIEEFRRSVTEYGGYYIARYEASYGTDRKPNSKQSTGVVHQDGVAYAPTTEGYLWNNIVQADAANVCRNMYDSSYGATGDLVNSYAWDTAIVFIQKYSGDSDYSMQNGPSIKATLTNTGSNEDERCHIYDMAGNCTEWTTETYSGSVGPCTNRGSYYDGTGSFTSYRYRNSITQAFRGISFRPILYL